MSLLDIVITEIESARVREGNSLKSP